MRRARELFQQAIDRDSSYAPAWSGLADASAILASWQFASPAEMYPVATTAARRAIELDDSLAEAHASLGFVKMNWEWDWDGVLRELRRAIEINPNHETAHRWLSAFLAGIGRREEAMPIAERAVLLDPLSVLPRMNLGIIHYISDDQLAAEAEFLLGTFGPAYTAYAARTPRFWPNPLLFRDEPELVFSTRALKQTCTIS